MGKYMKKAKNGAKLAVMDVSQSPLGVLTRAKGLALKGLQQTLSPSSGSPARSSSYRKLRNQRLKKPRVKQTRKQGQNPSSKARLRSRMGSVLSGSVSGSLANGQNYQKHEGTSMVVCDDSENKDTNDLGVEEASFGENVLDFECRERRTRESTPCNLIRDPDSIRTPSSTTRLSFPTEAMGRERISADVHIPTAQEMDEFFTQAEEIQHRQFIEKYNFDPVNDIPLPGRYQWETLLIWFNSLS